MITLFTIKDKIVIGFLYREYNTFIIYKQSDTIFERQCATPNLFKIFSKTKALDRLIRFAQYNLCGIASLDDF